MLDDAQTRGEVLAVLTEMLGHKEDQLRASQEKPKLSNDWKFNLNPPFEFISASAQEFVSSSPPFPSSNTPKAGNGNGKKKSSSHNERKKKSPEIHKKTHETEEERNSPLTSQYVGSSTSSSRKRSHNQHSPVPSSSSPLTLNNGQTFKNKSPSSEKGFSNSLILPSISSLSSYKPSSCYLQSSSPLNIVNGNHQLATPPSPSTPGESNEVLVIETITKLKKMNSGKEEKKREKRKRDDKKPEESNATYVQPLPSISHISALSKPNNNYSISSLISSPLTSSSSSNSSTSFLKHSSLTDSLNHFYHGSGSFSSSPPSQAYPSSPLSSSDENSPPHKSDKHISKKLRISGDKHLGHNNPDFESNVEQPPASPLSCTIIPNILSTLSELKSLSRDYLQQKFASFNQSLNFTGPSPIVNGSALSNTSAASYFTQHLNELDKIFQTQLLGYEDLKFYYEIRPTIQMYIKQYRMLIAKENGETDPSRLISLHILHQPLLKVLSKNNSTRNVQDHWQVKLISPYPLIHSSKLQALMVGHETARRTSFEKTKMQGDEQELSPSNLSANFPIKFLNGTNTCVVFLKFKTTITYQPTITTKSSNHSHNEIVLSLESPISNPFVVMTHESQWTGCVRLLLFLECFPDVNTQLPWIQFANILQFFFVESISKVEKPQRPLSVSELYYLHATAFGAMNTISKSQFETFWRWFGPSVHRLRFQKTVADLWRLGLITFFSRDDSERILSSYPLGTCIIRFSHCYEGLFVLSFVAHDKIRHYLVQPDDISGNRTLVSFLYDSAVITSFLYQEHGKFLVSEKHNALKSFNIKAKKNGDIPVGYDSLY